MSSSLPCNIPIVLDFIAKNIFSKVNVSDINIAELMEGNPFPPIDFTVLDVGGSFGKWK